MIDRQGRVAARAIGEVDRSRLLGLVEPILAEDGSATGVAEDTTSGAVPSESAAEKGDDASDGAEGT